VLECCLSSIKENEGEVGLPAEFAQAAQLPATQRTEMQRIQIVRPKKSLSCIDLHSKTHPFPLSVLLCKMSLHDATNRVKLRACTFSTLEGLSKRLGPQVFQQLLATVNPNTMEALSQTKD
jgi:hypothetical protein